MDGSLCTQISMHWITINFNLFCTPISLPWTNGNIQLSSKIWPPENKVIFSQKWQYRGCFTTTNTQYWQQEGKDIRIFRTTQIEYFKLIFSLKTHWIKYLPKPILYRDKVWFIIGPSTVRFILIKEFMYLVGYIWITKLKRKVY